MARAFAEIAFTPTVLEAQERQGSRSAYASWFDDDAERSDQIDDDKMAFIGARDGFYQATVSQTGWPYVQFRGGPPGFLRVIDEKTIGYADYRGNRQYVSLGNIADDPRISLILMDYPNRRRLKIFGRARHVDIREDPALVARLHAPGGRGKPERATIIDIDALDWNCPQHIPQRFTVDEIEENFTALREELVRLRQENQSLKAELA